MSNANIKALSFCKRYEFHSTKHMSQREFARENDQIHYYIISKTYQREAKGARLKRTQLKRQTHNAYNII